MAEDDEIDQVSGVISVVDQLQFALDWCRIILTDGGRCCNDNGK